jgi:N-methylhydantoinase A
MRFLFSADMRYVGQEYFVNQTIESDGPMTDATITGIVEAFHDQYRVRYGHATPDAPVEIVTLRVAAIGLLPSRVAGFEPASTASDRRETRPAIFDGQTYDSTILKRHLLPAGSEFSGPAVIEEETATTVLPPRWRGRVDEIGNLILTPARR